MNISKKNDPRMWAKWYRSGAVALPQHITVEKFPDGFRTIRSSQPTTTEGLLAVMNKYGFRPMTVEWLIGSCLPDMVPIDPYLTRNVSSISWAGFEPGSPRFVSFRPIG